MFHVEISAGYRHARVFNLSREDVMAKVVQPWLENRIIEAGEREWEPSESKLRVLEGPRMENSDLSFGQGWANAERSCEDVTRAIVEAAPPPTLPDAFVIETDRPETLTAEIVDGHDGRPVHWSDAQRWIDGRDPEIAAV
ncbi:MAG TPA: hypothetical protein VF731_02145, partial [Solirubrobacterales bacterium]